MRNSLTFFSIIQILLLSCNQPKIDSKAALADSLFTNYIKEVTSLKSIDTAQDVYRALLAYAKSDTILLRATLVKVENVLSYEKGQRKYDSCCNLFDIRKSNTEETYRFIYDGPLCNFRHIMTISKLDTSVKFYFEIYEITNNSDLCHLVESGNKNLTNEYWVSFQNKIDSADFWGLQESNGIQGVDGSSIEAESFIKRSESYNLPEKYKSIYRWGYSTLDPVIYMLIKLSENKKGCLQIGTR